MKISRSYLLGLGSGLILSALIVMVLPQGTIRLGDSPPASENQGAVKSGGLVGASDSGQAANPDQGSPGSRNPSKGDSPENSGAGSQVETAEATENKAEFIIPAGATAEIIAVLLAVGGFIPDKEKFLAYVKEKMLESRFNRGTFELRKNMSVEEIVNQLIR